MSSTTNAKLAADVNDECGIIGVNLARRVFAVNANQNKICFSEEDLMALLTHAATEGARAILKRL